MSVENSQDPRLKRIFGVEGQEAKIPETPEEPDKLSAPQFDPRMSSGPAAPSSDPRMDPRRRKEATTAIQSPGGPQMNSGLDIQIVLQKSPWYSDLGSKNKIFVNQQLAVLTSEQKRYHEEVSVSGPRPFDLSSLFQQSPMLFNVLQQLNVLVDEQGAIQPAGPQMGLPPPSNPGGDPNMMMPDLAAMIQQQQMPPNMFNNPGMAGHPMLMQQMGNPGMMRPGLLGCSPNMGFPGPQQQQQQPPPQHFDDFGGGGGGGEMGNFRMNFNDNNMGGPPPGMVGGGGPFFQQQQQQQQGPPNNRMMNNNNNRGNFRNNNNRWMNNNKRGGGGNDGRRRRD